MEKFLGIDIGGTNIKIAVVDKKGKISSKIKYSSNDRFENEGFDHYLVQILKKEFGKHPKVSRVGIGIPGTLSVDRTTLLELHNLPELNGNNLTQTLSLHFPDKVFKLENDANAAALGEYYFTNGTSPSNCIFVTLGTGVGGGVIIDNTIFKGGDGNGLEIGHILVGNRRTLEQNIGKKGIMERAQELMNMGVATSLEGLNSLDPKKILAEAENGDKVSLKIFEEVGTYLGEALVSTIRLFDIKTVIIGGGLAASFDIIKKPAKKVLLYNLTKYYTDNLVIKKASLGNNAGIIGAASLCFMDKYN